MGSAIRVGGLVVVLGLLLGRAASPPSSLTPVEQLRKARCAERGGSFESVNGRWHCLAR